MLETGLPWTKCCKLSQPEETGCVSHLFCRRAKEDLCQYCFLTGKFYIFHMCIYFFMERHLALNHSLSLKKMQFFYTSQFTAILSGKCPHDIQTHFFCFHDFDEGVYWLKWDILEVREIFARAVRTLSVLSSSKRKNFSLWPPTATYKTHDI